MKYFFLLTFLCCLPLQVAVNIAGNEINKEKSLAINKRNDTEDDNLRFDEIRRISSNESLFKTDDNKIFMYQTIQLEHQQNVNLMLKGICNILRINESNCTCSELDDFHNQTNVCQINVKCSVEKISMVRMVLIAIISVFGIVGNFLVIMIRVKYWNPSTHYQLITGLSVADLIFSIITLVHISAEIHSPCIWLYSSLMCKTIQSLLSLSGYVDIGFILMIAVERYIGIVHPYTRRFSRVRSCQMIVLNVAICILIIIPSFIYSNVTKDGTACVFKGDKQTRRITSWVTMLCFFVIPVIMTSFFSYKCIKSLNNTMFEHDMLAAMDPKSRHRHVVDNKKIMRVLIFMLAAFFVLTVPHHIVWIILTENVNISHSEYSLLRFFAGVSYSLHVAINPVIYSILDQRFRNHAKNFIYCRQRNEDSEYDVSRSRVTTHEEADTSL